jgi:hypothetical protein
VSDQRRNAEGPLNARERLYGRVAKNNAISNEFSRRKPRNLVTAKGGSGHGGDCRCLAARSPVKSRLERMNDMGMS